MRPCLRAAMTEAFGGSDAEGAWDWKAAYDACEASQLLFLRKFGPAMRARAAAPAAFLAMLGKLAHLFPTHTRRSEESQALQQFSTPIALGFVAATAAALTRQRSRARAFRGHRASRAFSQNSPARAFVLNELADTRADLLGQLFADCSVTQHDAAHIDDYLDPSLRPSVVLMNPPFSAAAHVEGRVADAALRHIGSALARLCDGGRLVAITGANLSPENLAWREALHPSARAGARGVLGGDRRPCLCAPRHDDRDSPPRDRSRACRRSDDIPGFARHGA